MLKRDLYYFFTITHLRQILIYSSLFLELIT
jgi:hypothetical protein